MFVELDELRLGDNQEWAWQEKARWIKFEEEIEEGALRWGKPHVSSLSFHSLLELRRCLEQGLRVSHYQEFTLLYFETSQQCESTEWKRSGSEELYYIAV